MTAQPISGLGPALPVQTTKFMLTQYSLEATVRSSGIAVICGPPGCGKTYAVRYFLDGHRGTQSSYLQMPHRPAKKEVTVRLLAELTRTTPSGEQYNLTEMLHKLLYDSHRIVVIDEAHHLTEGSLQDLRYLHDRGDRTWTLVLVGSRIDESIKRTPELKSRVTKIVRFEALTGKELMQTLRIYHPLLAASEVKQLHYVDEQWGHGFFRNWETFTDQAAELTDDVAAGLTNDLIGMTLAAIGADDWKRP